LPERPYFHEHLTGEKLLEFYGTLSGMKRADLLSRIPAVLKAVGMSDARKLELKHYSKGMLQRIGIAQAILHDPPCLVLDEPMSGLDPQGRKEIQELLLQFASEGRTLFFSSHHFSEVKEMCNHLAIIRKGRLIASGSIQMYPNLETLFLNEWVKKEGDR
jgi:ABC-2 type transport system ATP-binding protein